MNKRHWWKIREFVQDISLVALLITISVSFTFFLDMWVNG